MDFGQALVDAVRAAVGVPAAAYALAAVGLNLQFGYTGLLNFGQVGFLLVGAYGTAITADHGLPLPLAFLVGVAAAVALGLILGLPTLRLRAEYLAIVTISAAEILRLVVRSRPLEGFTGGAFGIREFADSFYNWNPIPSGQYGVGSVTFSDRTLWVMLVGWSLVALTSMLIYLLVRSPWGRVLRGIRDDEHATRSLGKNVFAFKLQSLVLGGSIGALAGILLAVDAQFTNADYWQSIFTFFAFTVIIIGGVGRVIGPVVGSMLFWFLLQGTDTLLQQALANSLFGSKLGPTEAGPIRFALVGLVLMLLMIFRPQGLFGSRAETLIEER
jgi:branched-chain amino acid transport system permease protein